MSDIYYYGNQPMLKYISDGTPCAVPIDKVAADLIESQQATITSLRSFVERVAEDDLWMEDALAALKEKFNL